MKNNVIYNIIMIINSDKYYGISKEIEIIKGKNKLKSSINERIEQLKRNFIFFIKNKIY